MAGWCFGIFVVPFSWEFDHPDELHDFSEGWLNHQPDGFYKVVVPIM